MAVLRVDFLSEMLCMQTNITVVIPSRDFNNPNEKEENPYREGYKYQTLYLLHGGTGDDLDYMTFTSIARYAMENHIAVVMPSAYNMFYADREGGKFFSFINEELPRFCEYMFPLSPRREDRYVGGLSMGCAGAIKSALFYPEQYEGVLAMSSSSALTDTYGKSKAGPALFNANRIPGEAARNCSRAEQNIAEKKPLPKFYMTVGGDDFCYEKMKENGDYLKDLGYQVEWREIPGYKHQWEFWDQTLKYALDEWLPLKREQVAL
ncbi:MAG: hypothetical protein K5682_10640 [Lachnospiraceae bacterium]|nr:hypothetical protein [Lachnospiraceae bacterium]